MSVPPPTRFDILLAEYLEGHATQPALDELAALLEAEPALRRQFLDACAVEGLLWNHHAGRAQERALLERTLKSLPPERTGETTVRRVMARISEPRRSQGRNVWLQRAALGAAAVVVLGIAVWAGTRFFGKQPAAPQDVVQAPPETHVTPEQVNVPPEKANVPPEQGMQTVTLAHVNGPVFVRKGAVRSEAKVGQVLAAGETVEAGELGRTLLGFSSGSRLDLSAARGPALLQLVSNKAGVEVLVENGIAEASVRGGGPFVLRSKPARARVTGTRLRLAVDTDAARLEVYEGQVELTRISDNKRLSVAAGEFADVAASAEFAVRQAAGRDTLRQPFDARSPWNMPLGSNAVYADETSSGWDPAQGAAVQVSAFALPIFAAANNDPPQALIRQSTGKEVFRTRVPAAATPSAGMKSLVLVDPYHRFAYELNNAERQPGGGFKATELACVDLRGLGVFSAPNGGRIYGGSALGGLLRQGELTRGIPHALAISIPHKAINANGPSGKAFVWPACDAAANPQAKYGANGNVFLGTLVALPPEVKLDTLGLGTSGPGYELARALQDYGAYVVESHTQAPQHLFFFAEPACAAEVPGDLDAKLSNLTRFLKVVSNNGPQSLGGGGTPRRPLAGPLVDFGAAK